MYFEYLFGLSIFVIVQKIGINVMEGNKSVWEKVMREAGLLLRYLMRNGKEIGECAKADSRSETLGMLLSRILRNLRGVYALAAESVKHGDSVMLKLPVGLILRNCLMDGTLALYIAQNGIDACDKLNALFNRDYVSALFQEYEVYRDKLSIGFDDVMAEHLYTMAIEDRYLHELKPTDAEIGPMCERNMWQAQDYKDIYEGCKRSDADLRKMKDKLIDCDAMGDCVKSLYAYYKYFSQYEHFSQRGNGDSIVDFGCDNIRFEKVFTHLSDCIEYLVEIALADRKVESDDGEQ